jgi:hypothetical protein
VVLVAADMVYVATKDLLERANVWLGGWVSTVTLQVAQAVAQIKACVLLASAFARLGTLARVASTLVAIPTVRGMDTAPQGSASALMVSKG